MNQRIAVALERQNVFFFSGLELSHEKNNGEDGKGNGNGLVPTGRIIGFYQKKMGAVGKCHAAAKGAPKVATGICGVHDGDHQDNHRVGNIENIDDQNGQACQHNRDQIFYPFMLQVSSEVLFQ